KTAADVKGGIAIIDQFNKLNCGDIGVAVSKEEVAKAEAEGKTILFNTATGLFDLKYLLSVLERVIEKLPMRISTQDKDAGVYQQMEQVTWEVIGMIEDPLLLAVDKYDRFIAAKMLVEG